MNRKNILTLIVSFLLLPLYSWADTKDELWKTIELDTFPYNYQYKYEKKTADKMLEELNLHLKTNSEDHDYELKTTLLYQALAGNKNKVDSLIKVSKLSSSPNTNELLATQLFIDWLSCDQYPDTKECQEKLKALQTFLRNNYITEDVNEAMKWHWINKMVTDSVLIDRESKDFIYTPQLDEKDNLPEYKGAVLSTHRFQNSTNVLISDGYNEPIRLFELDKKGKWKNITKEAHLDSIPGGQRMYAVDINNDGLQDIFIVRKMSSGRLFYLYPTLLVNQGDGTYLNLGKDIGFNVPQRANCACFLDANGDGRLDIFVGNENYGSQLYIQTDSLQFVESANQYGLITKPYKIRDCVAIDVNHDNQLDLLLSTYNYSNYAYIHETIGDKFPFFIDKAKDYNFFAPYKGGHFLVGDYNGNQNTNVIANTDHSTNDRDVISNILSGTYGPDEFPIMWNLENFNSTNTLEQYPLLTYSNTYLNIDKGNSRPYILFGGGKNWDEYYPLTFYQFLDDHYFYQLMKLKHQPNFVSSMTITPSIKTQQPVIWMKGGYVNSALKNNIATYLQNGNEGQFYRIQLIGKYRKDALGSKITLTTEDAKGKPTKRTRVIQITDSQGGGAGQEIWYLPQDSKIHSIEILWTDQKSQTFIPKKIKNNTITIIQE
ncbi:MAG TPA: VCBS repeat-containing protein [Chitinophagales bacterium]|nr:VCBS repeat-containing protein [Chitinophagales bacterium]